MFSRQTLLAVLAASAALMMGAEAFAPPAPAARTIVSFDRRAAVTTRLTKR